MSENPNAAQSEYWNSDAGEKWIKFQEDLDTVFQPITERLLEHAAPRPGERALDIGCGTGATTMQLALRLGPGGSVLGLDISHLLLARAEERRRAANLGNLHYNLGDAQTQAFDADAFDLLISRFGVMFFADPVAAFANLASGLTAEGRLSFVSWGPLSRNPWFDIPKAAAVARMGAPKERPLRAPGPLAFSETDYVVDILSQAGFREISVAVETVFLERDGPVEEAAQLAANLGPSNRIVREFDGTQADFEEIARSVASAFEVYSEGGRIRLPACLNFFDVAKSVG